MKSDSCLEENLFQKQIEDARNMIEARLSGFFTDHNHKNKYEDTGLEAAMRYSLMAGGKRIRPILTLKFCEAAGGNPENALDFGCGLELMHTYSLIHDDLPCADNDSLRRGKPTCHIQFDECTALLAGDALQTAAFDTILSAQGNWPDTESGLIRALAGKILAEAAGIHGMCGGQYWDTIGNGQMQTLEMLHKINRKKTGALLQAACVLGVLAALGSDSEHSPQMQAAGLYAENLGLAFQIRDDILDNVSTEQELGKPIGSDIANQKMTYASLLGLDHCETLILDFTKKAKTALLAESWAGDISFLLKLADVLAVRRN